MPSSRLDFATASELYQGMLTTSDIGFLILDKNYDIQHFSQQAKAMLNIEANTLHFLDYIDLPNTEKAKRMLQTIQEEQQVSDWEMSIFNGSQCIHLYFTGHYYKNHIVLMLKPLSSSINNLQNVVSKVNSELTNSNRELARKQAQLQKAHQQINDLHQAISKQNELMKQDLRMAKIVQKALIDKVSSPHNKVVLEKAYHPAASIGGDLYDVVNINEDLSGILICDVSGHGVASALVMAVLKNIFRNHAKDFTQPHLFLEKMNQEFAEIFGSQSIELYATAFYMIIDTANGQLYYAGAGHPYPYFYSPVGTQELIAPGFPIGLFDKGNYQTLTMPYSPEDRLLLFTDGFSEYIEAIEGKTIDPRQYSWGSIQTVFKQVAQDLKQQNHPQHDDVCVLIVSFKH